MGLIPISHFPTPSFPLPNKPLVLKVLSLSHLLEAPNQDTGNVRGSTVCSGLPSEHHCSGGGPACGLCTGDIWAQCFQPQGPTSSVGLTPPRKLTSSGKKMPPQYRLVSALKAWGSQGDSQGHSRPFPLPSCSQHAPSMLPRVPTGASRICPPPPLCGWHKYSLPTMDQVSNVWRCCDK